MRAYASQQTHVYMCRCELCIHGDADVFPRSLRLPFIFSSFSLVRRGEKGFFRVSCTSTSKHARSEGGSDRCISLKTEAGAINENHACVRIFRALCITLLASIRVYSFARFSVECARDSSRFSPPPLCFSPLQILRGSDECGIEDNVVAGIYKQ
jgi:hypothetical protein